MSTSRPNTGSSAGWSRPHGLSCSPKPLTYSALHLRHPCRWPDVLPSATSPQLHRHQALRLLRLHLQAPVPSRITSPRRL